MKKALLLIVAVFSSGYAYAAYGADINDQIEGFFAKAAKNSEHKEFGSKLVADIDKQFAEFAKNDCKSDNDGPCGYQFEPLYCAQDKDEPKVLAVSRLVNNKYLVDISWGRRPNSYIIDRKNNNFEIEAILCRFDDGNELKFNWK